MMTEQHECEWHICGYSDVAVCYICHDTMDEDEAERRLNATSRLSAKEARNAMGALWAMSMMLNVDDTLLPKIQKPADALQAYADILEGK